MVVTVQNLALKQECATLICLAESLKQAVSLQEKLELLRLFPRVAAFLGETSPLRGFLETLSPERELVMLSVIAINQAERVFSARQDPFPRADFQALIEELL